MLLLLLAGCTETDVAARVTELASALGRQLLAYWLL
jgi:hypothetical protein